MRRLEGINLKNSDERVQFIADYISAYEEKIKLLNINGLLMLQNYLNCLQLK